MSNITPQKPGFNRGIWKKLEAQVRHWAETEEEIIVVTGAILPKEVTLTVGPGRIPVPEAFFKVVYDLTPPQKMIAFIIPNESSKQACNQGQQIENINDFPADFSVTNTQQNDQCR